MVHVFAMGGCENRKRRGTPHLKTGAFLIFVYIQKVEIYRKKINDKTEF